MASRSPEVEACGARLTSGQADLYAIEPDASRRLDLRTGRFSGCAYGANVGWIGLSNEFGSVKTDVLRDTDSDIGDPWEYTFANTLTALTATGDFDHDGISDRDEFVADTDPMNSNDYLRITRLQELSAGTISRVTWKSESTRLYQVEHSLSASNNATWADSGLGIQSPDFAPTMEHEFPDSARTSYIFRIRALRPPMGQAGR